MRKSSGSLHLILHFIRFSIWDLVEELRSTYFRELSCRIEFYFRETGTLACCIRDSVPGAFRISAHQVLNHEETPFEVLSFVCKHEILHRPIPPRRIGKRRTAHPPEFEEREREISPERGRAWAWIWINLGIWLKSRPRLERIDVLKNWRSVWQSPKLTIPETLDPAQEQYVPY